MQTIATYHIHLKGLVQGVGMRPFVARLADQYQVNGWISNSTDGVHIEITSSEETAKKFLQSILKLAPPNAIIHQHEMKNCGFKPFCCFEILESNNHQPTSILLTPDISICDHCRTELYSETSRRFRYPFITCTECGPRYSISLSTPYDRANTSMSSFKMCNSCEDEYKSIGDRRFHSQTNSCQQCGITMLLFEKGKEHVDLKQNEIVPFLQERLMEGKIVAVKGIGGYVLLCDSTNATSLKSLRQRKLRPSKPFALLFKDISQVESFANISEEEKDCISSASTPILLLNRKPNASICFEDIAPGLSQIGCMLPGSPLLELIVSSLSHPLVCTSANTSDSPIIFRNDEALRQLNSIADLILIHDRDITNAQDDSVIRICSQSKQKIIIRRARGLAPNYLGYSQKNQQSILATGALMKSSFTLQINNKTFVSQYLGNTSSIEAQETYRRSLEVLSGLLQFYPDRIIADKHPEYFSAELASEISLASQKPITKVQHHKAHFAAILAEHDLFDVEQTVIGVIWDGLGLGDDGQIWGSEFFKFENKEIKRCYHFDYFPLLLNDKMAKEPRLSALAICDDIPESDEIL